MVPEWNYLIVLQIDYQRWPLGAVGNNSTNTKVTISQEPLDEIDPALCQNVSCIGLSRKGGGQKNNLISIPLNKFS